LRCNGRQPTNAADNARRAVTDALTLPQSSARGRAGRTTLSRSLTARQDAFGRSLLDYLHGKPGRQLVERSDGLIDAQSGTGMYFQLYAQWSDYERWAADLARGRVLDVGCGAGRFALHLQERGCEVVGIDTSPGALEVCRARGVRDVREIALADVGPELGTFDTILMMGNNFGLFANAGRTRRLLRRFHRLTTADARIVAEVLDPYRTDDPLHLGYHEQNRRRGRMAGQIRLRVRYHNLRTPWFDYLFVSADELRTLAAPTGWHVVQILESGGLTYVAVLEKAKAGE